MTWLKIPETKTNAQTLPAIMSDQKPAALVSFSLTIWHIPRNEPKRDPTAVSQVAPAKLGRFSDGNE